MGQWNIVKALVEEQYTLVFYMCLTFTITLAVFLSLTALVRLINSGGFFAQYFIQLNFVAFNLGDLIRRYLPAVRFLLIKSSKGIRILSYERLVLISVFLMSHLKLGQGIYPAFSRLLASDSIFFLTAAVLFISNKYLGSILMMSAPAQKNDVSHCETMASIMVLALAIGLTSGSIISFSIQAIACGCNPF